MENQHPVLVRALAQCLNDIFVGGYYADKVIVRAFKFNRKWGSRDRKFMAETIYDMVRWWNLLARLDGGAFVLNSPDGYIRRWIYYEAWKNKGDQVGFVTEKMPEVKLPDEPFENILKRINKVDLSPWEEIAFPQWLYEKIQTQYGGESRQILESLNTPAPVSLRVNTLKTTRDDVIQRLEQEGVVAVPFADIATGLLLKERQNVFITKVFREGFFEVQDLASQSVSVLLDPKPGERIADVCAGAGGKTLHLAALMQNKGTLLAGDNFEKKLDQLKIRARRAGVSNMRIQEFKTTKDIKKHHEKFDGVLLDVPCSGTGVIRRNADTKWKMSLEELKRLGDLQRKILGDYSKMVKPGGRLVYSTCSLLEEENQLQVQWFLENHPGWSLAGKPLVTRPDLNQQDGFFAQKFSRN